MVKNVSLLPQNLGQQMFIGEYYHSFDKKGRLAIPKKLREQLPQGAVLTRGLDQCLFLFSAEEWEKISEKLKNLPITESAARTFTRYILSGATQVEFDALGRIIVPIFLRNYASVLREATVLGVGNRIEIWNAKSWEKYKVKAEKESEKTASQLIGTGI